jgi:coatomer subunit beta
MAAVKGESDTTSSAMNGHLSYVAAASCFISLAIKESDNNVKLIVLDRLDNLRAKHGPVLESLILDILQVLSRSVLKLNDLAFAHIVIALILRFAERLCPLS